MLSKKSFGGNKRNFLKLPMRFVRSDVRDHIVSLKNDHGPSYRHYRASQRRSSPKNHHLRDFWRRSIFDFFDSIGQTQT
jgi:hypothetical protein